MATKKYSLKSDEQKGVLKRLYDEGMTGKGTILKEKISEAMRETGLSEDAVKNWISSEKKKRKSEVDIEVEVAPKAAKMTYIRGPTSYNNFYKKLSQSDHCKELSLPERNTYAAEEWRKLSQKDKEKYKEKTVTDPNTMTDKDRKKMVKKYTQQLKKLVDVLEGYGSSVVVMTIEAGGELYGFGSQDGHDFLSTNPDVMYKFKNQISEVNPNVTYKDITKLYNQKYSEMIGRPSRVPYLKGGFEVKGLPDDLSFKKPFMYGTRQMRRIVAVKDEISFHPASSTVSDSVADTTNTRPGETKKHITDALRVIAGEEVTTRVLQGGELISEEEVEVTNLSLDFTKMWAIQSEGVKYFQPDAWLALQGNLQHERNGKGVVLPVLSEERDERFWLFYSTLKLGKVLSAGIHKPLPGYWLNLDDSKSSQYNILSCNPTTISKVNIVKLEDGSPLYHQCTLDVSKDKYMLDNYFRYAIMMVLDRTINLTLDS